MAALLGISAPARFWISILQRPFDIVFTENLSAYWLVLFYLATKVEHKMPGWKARCVLTVSWQLTTVLGRLIRFGPWSLLIAAGMLR